ncbi:methyltransferase domain-containing protein [Gilvimarinus sp. DA14]|uniref:methyltransferase domain-containing protein n=1 Tax=Gilvimarinus sp. DA14 TaxID=2956798 RepID=UPI0020B63CDA|nr:methyltransferase domain-containing protein [Gilvimarinus sp. DA14]UTF60582.1 class I SAM-dependent methyltransferase [Gilvimarinus sp. DA14]
MTSKVCEPDRAVVAASQWFAGATGQAMLKRQQADIDKALACVFGYHLCQISVCRALNLTASSRIPHKFALNPLADGSGWEGARGDLSLLPLACESVDAVVLHHALDYSATPQQLLAEAARATIPRGYIVIQGFNPWSVQGVWHWSRRHTSGQPLWQHHHLRLGRLLDWFAVLGLSPVALSYGRYWPGAGPCEGLENSCQRLKLPWGSYYTACVRKDVMGALALKPDWSTVEVRALGPAQRKASREGCRSELFK